MTVILPAPGYLLISQEPLGQHPSGARVYGGTIAGRVLAAGDMPEERRCLHTGGDPDRRERCTSDLGLLVIFDGDSHRTHPVHIANVPHFIVHWRDVVGVIQETP